MIEFPIKTDFSYTFFKFQQFVNGRNIIQDFRSLMTLELDNRLLRFLRVMPLS